ncbi:acyl-CoA dehydrogenase family protein [Brevibacillus formosus]|uniref:acyl-CoA dehydrogenase family protein n=1 Tax=Brevibacillus formosus TaxID=54913 RepID=UPI0018CF7054|nr:acyl-CoA dehydrogenase family protein [Brevibacillus formosus]MBG9941024.1 hypothetical protein [Brevibacillus formosus]
MNTLKYRPPLEIIKEFNEFTFTPKNTSEKINFLLDNKFHCFPLYYNEGSFSAKEYFHVVSCLAEVCSTTALSMSMHLYTVWGLSLLHKHRVNGILGLIPDQNALFGSLNEPGLYFVSENNLNSEEYPVLATKTSNGDGYIVSGIKHFVSLEPFVRFLPVYCLTEQEDGRKRLIALIVDKKMSGVSIRKDWNSMSMNETFSNSINFENVFVPNSLVLSDIDQSISEFQAQRFLFRFNVASVYYGIAKKAIDYIVDTSQKKKVPHTGRTLSFFPGVQYSLAEMMILLQTSASQIYYCANLVDDYARGESSVSKELNSVSLITKEYVIKSSEEIVNIAMKIEGISSLSNTSLLSSLYKDVKAGLFHPPQSDVTMELLAKDKLGIISLRNRWF